MTEYKKNGIPILKDVEIEQKAYNLLSEIDDTSINTPMKAPIEDIFNYLKSNYDLKLIYTDLGIINNHRIYGSTLLSKNNYLYYFN